MLQSIYFDDVKRRLLRSAQAVLARGMVVTVATILAVAGASALVSHMLRAENLAKVRLQRAGYAVNEAAAFQAIERNDPLALVRLQTAGVSLAGHNAQGWTPYEAALRSDRLPLLDTLASLGAAPDLPPAVREQCLIQALERGALDTAAFLLRGGTSPDVEVEPGLPALAWCMTTRRPAAVDLLIRHRADIAVKSKYGTPLVIAYGQSDLGLFERLLSLGADPDQAELAGRALGPVTILDGRLDYTRKLLAARADPNATGKDGVSMMEAAFGKRLEPLFLELVRAGGNLSLVDGQRRTFLERAAAERDHHWMELLLTRGLDPNQRTALRNDPLWWDLYRRGDPHGAELLLRSGADIGAPDGSGVAPVDVAIRQGDYAVARYLFARGARASADLWGLLKERKYELLRLVLAHGADPNLRDAAGLAPLSLAIRNGDVTAAGLLMEYGARVELRNRPDGHSLLEWAMSHRSLPLMEFVLNNGGNVNEVVERPLHPAFLAAFKENGNLIFHLKGDSNVTPLMIAAGSHQLEAARVLLAHGAKRYQWTRRYRSDPVTFAIRSENLPMAQLMLGREPELDGQHVRKIVVSRSDQRARFYKNGQLVYSTRCSTGKSGYRTPGGTFVITDKARLRYSTLYDAAMPFFHRLSGSAVGMHEGYVPGYPASHGCIRLPYQYAKIFYEQTKVGDIVVVE